MPGDYKKTNKKQTNRNTEKLRHVSKKKQTYKSIKTVSDHQHLIINKQ